KMNAAIDSEEAYDIRSHLHNIYEYLFDGSIGAPVIEKLQNGAKVSPEYPNTAFYGADSITPNSNGNITYIECNLLEKLPFPDEEFDYIFSRDYVNFFKNDGFHGFLSEVIRILKPGGWFEVAFSARQILDGGPAFPLWNSAWLSWFKSNNINNDFMLHLEDYLQKTQKFECIEHQTAKFFLGKGNNEMGEFAEDFFFHVLKNLKVHLLPYLGISNNAYDDLVKEIEIDLKSGKSKPYNCYHRIFGKKKELLDK
ncbi:2414_t:CDS:2, partial [Scutellospora calospora]